MNFTPLHLAWLKREGYKMARIDCDQMKISYRLIYSGKPPVSGLPGALVTEIDFQDPLASATPLIGDIPSPDLNQLRYEFVRRMSPRQFADLYQENLSTATPFDELVDREIAKEMGV